MSLQRELRRMAAAHHIDLWGAADLARAREFIRGQGGEEVACYPRSVSIGIRLPDPIVDALPRGQEHSVRVSYRHHAYEVINQRLDLAASLTSSVLHRRGHRALPVPASRQVDQERICAVFSHKLGANLAGLGWIGKCCLLVTPRYGPRVRWATVLTDAPLRPTGGPSAERCGECRACVDICPARAFTGRPFREEEPRSERYEARKCQRHLQAMTDKGELAVCGLCLYACPYGRAG